MDQQRRHRSRARARLRGRGPRPRSLPHPPGRRRPRGRLRPRRRRVGDGPGAGMAGLLIALDTLAEEFRAALGSLPDALELLTAAAVPAVGTWIRPMPWALDHAANWRLHAGLLSLVSEILADGGGSPRASAAAPRARPRRRGWRRPTRWTPRSGRGTPRRDRRPAAPRSRGTRCARRRDHPGCGPRTRPRARAPSHPRTFAG